MCYSTGAKLLALRVRCSVRKSNKVSGLQNSVCVGKMKNVLQPKSQTSPFTLLENGRAGTKLYFSFTLTLNRAAFPHRPLSALSPTRGRAAPRRFRSQPVARADGCRSHARPTTNFRGRGTSSTRGGTTGQGSRRDSAVPPASGSVPRPFPASAPRLPPLRPAVPSRLGPRTLTPGAERREEEEDVGANGQKEPAAAAGIPRHLGEGRRAARGGGRRSGAQSARCPPLPQERGRAASGGWRYRRQLPPPLPPPPGPGRTGRQRREEAEGRRSAAAAPSGGLQWIRLANESLTNPRSGLRAEYPTRKPKLLLVSIASHSHRQTSSICYQKQFMVSLILSATLRNWKISIENPPKRLVC